LQKDAPISTHSCKYSLPGFWVDELFELTGSGYLRLPEYDLCLSADGLDAGAHVNSIDCAAASVHAWNVSSGGRVSPADAPALCLTLAAEKVYVNSSPANLTPYSSRSISIEPCARSLVTHQQWKWSDPSEQKTQTANMLRSGMSPAVAKAIRELGAEIRPPETAALYANEPRMFGAADVSVSDVIAYGPVEGQQLQVYSGINRNNPQNAAPILVLVHGGGFSAGGLDNLVHVATHFAALGYLVVNVTYPLAPGATWPSGSDSVAGAIRWVKDNAADNKANPERIFVLGHSAGGAHVADYVFRPGLGDGDSPVVAGAILASPVLVLDPENPAPFTAAYFGEDSDEWEGRQTVGNIERTSIPVLTLVAEYDPDMFHTGTARLLNELVVDNDVKTRIRQMPGHNHISYILSIGTGDTLAVEEVIDFMSTAGHD
jgi:triacylglycerol lipase